MKRIIIQSICCLSAFLVSHLCLAQKDSLVLKTKNVIVGEIKSLDKGVFSIETDYSDKDFQVEWSGIKEIFLIGWSPLQPNLMTSHSRQIPGNI